jgi:hypothetical protein
VNSGVASFVYKNKKCNNEFLIPFLWTNKIIDQYDVLKNVGLDTVKTPITKKDFRKIKKCGYSNRFILTKDAALAIAIAKYPLIKSYTYSIGLNPSWWYSISIRTHENEGSWYSVNAITGQTEEGIWTEQE